MRVVAIDGPAGAGKSTVARAVADRLGIAYLDTGAMYRAVALAALNRGFDLDDEPAMTSLAEEIDIEIDGNSVRLNGDDVSLAIRGDRVTAAVSRVAALAGVRRAMAARQRSMAEVSDIVMEGRDIASYVVPDAAVKIFLTASIEQRAERRGLELGLPTDESSLAELAAVIEQRDRADSERDESPFVMAEGAVVVDSSGKDVARVVDEIVDLARRVIDGR